MSHHYLDQKTPIPRLRCRRGGGLSGRLLGLALWIGFALSLSFPVTVSAQGSIWGGLGGASCPANMSCPGDKPLQCPASEAGNPDTCQGDGAASQSEEGAGAGAGNPINLITGNKYQQETDMAALPGVLGLEIVRHYNSKHARDVVPGVLGRGWRLSYETMLTVQPNVLHIVQADGKRISFDRDPKNPGLCTTRDPGRGQVLVHRTQQGEESYTWVWTRGPNAGRRLEFDHRGKLTKIAAPSGDYVSLTYNPRGFLEQVTDPQGRSLKLNYPQAGGGPNRYQGVASIDSPVGRYTYTYGDPDGGKSLGSGPKLAAYRPPEAGAEPPAATTSTTSPAQKQQKERQRISNLVRVGWPQAGGRQYHYEDARYPNLLTGVSQQSEDGTAKRLSTFGYDKAGYAVLSESVAAERVQIASRSRPQPEKDGQPGQPGHTELENGTGGKTHYTHAIIGRENRLLESRGEGCPSCGPANMRYRYNQQSLVLEATQLDKAGDPISGLRKHYDAWGRVLRIERIDYQGKAAQLLVRYQYPAPIVTPEGARIAFDRPALIARPSVVPGREHRIELAWNQRGQLTQVTETGYRPALPLLTGEREPESGFIKTAMQSSAPSGEPKRIERTSTYRYVEINGKSLLAEIDGPLPNGPQASPEDSDITRYHWDEQGRFIESIEQPGGMTRRLQRDEAGRVASALLDDGIRNVETRTAYTPRGVLTELTRRAWTHDDPQTVHSKTQSYRTDFMGRPIEATSSESGTQQFAYDERGRLSGYTAPGGERVEWRYGQNNRAMAQVVFDAQGEVSQARMDVRDETGRVLATLSPGNIDSFRPARPMPTGAMRTGRWGEEWIEAGGFRKRTWRDDFGRVVATLSPADGLTLNNYEVSPAGEKQTQTHLGRQLNPSEARQETLRFDPAGRLIQREHPTCTETLTYEGRLLTRLESCGSTQHFERNAFGQITEHRQDLGAHTYRDTYQYDDKNRLIERQTAGGNTLNYQYDNTGRLQSVSRPRGWALWLSGTSVGRTLLNWLPENWSREALQQDLSYAPLASQPSGANYGNGARWQDRYDPAGRLEAARLDTKAGTVYQARTTWYQNKPVQEDKNGILHTRLYDPAGRLLPGWLDPDKVEGTHAWLLPVSIPQPQAQAQTVAMPIGAPAVAGPVPAVLKPTRFYTANGFRTAAWDGQSTDTTPQRNPWGEQIERAGQKLIWDDEGNLAGIEQDGKKIASYQYDARGVRIGKTLHKASGDEQTTYLYDTERRLSAETDAQGNIKREYLYNGIRPYAMLEGKRLTAIYSDVRGLPLVMLDEKQQVVWRGNWNDWGAPLGEAADNPINLRLAGQYHDAESGLYYNVHRYYDPDQGAYISPDPLGERLGEHRYAYVNNDPVSGVDPLGLFPFNPGSGYTAAWSGNFSVVDEANLIDNGHADIVNAAFALYQQQSGIQFSREIINQIIKNNYQTDALTDPSSGTKAGQYNGLNHFDNPNNGPMYQADGTTLIYSNNYMTWIKDALGQIDNNRNAYGAKAQPGLNVGFLDISENIGRLGQNLHTLADFYAHTNWVDNVDRGGCYKRPLPLVNQTHGFVPFGLGNSGLWDGSTEVGNGKLFSGTAEPLDISALSNDRSTHAYWNKDAADSTGGKVKLDQDRQDALKGQCFWQATTFDKASGYNYSASSALAGYGDYITETGDVPGIGSKERVYVCQKIETQYDLAMKLAIDQTVQEIEEFYKKAANVVVGKKADGKNQYLTDILQMNATQLENAKIEYQRFPDKETAYVK